MKKTNLLSIFTVVTLLVASIVGCGGKTGDAGYTANNTEYVIGVSGPLTGDAAVYGQAVQNSAQLAVDEINAAGGLNDIKFKLVALDDVNDATKLSTNFSTLLEGGMQISLGTVTTQPGLEFKEYSADDNVFFLTPSASGDDIPTNDNGFQMCFADGNQGAVAANAVNAEYKNQAIGVFYKSDDPYSSGIYKQFKENLDDSIEVIEAPFQTGATDYNAQIDKLKECKFVFMPIYYQPASDFMLQAKTKMAADATYFGCDGFDGIETKFDINSIPQKVTMLSHFNSKAETGAAADFIKKYTEKYGKDTLNQFGASAYDCVYAIYTAMKEAIDEGKEIPVTISASDLSDILKDKFANGFTYENGVTGDSIKWDKTGYVNKDALQYVIKDASK